MLQGHNSRPSRPSPKERAGIFGPDYAHQLSTSKLWNSCQKEAQPAQTNKKNRYVMLIGVQFYVSFPAGCLKVCPALAISSKKMTLTKPNDTSSSDSKVVLELRFVAEMPQLDAASPTRREWLQIRFGPSTPGPAKDSSLRTSEVFFCLTAASVGDHRPSWASLRHDNGMGKASGILWSQPPVMTYCDPKAAAPRHLSIPLCQVQILVDDVCSDH